MSRVRNGSLIAREHDRTKRIVFAGYHMELRATATDHNRTLRIAECVLTFCNSLSSRSSSGRSDTRHVSPIFTDVVARKTCIRSEQFLSGPLSQRWGCAAFPRLLSHMLFLSLSARHHTWRFLKKPAQKRRTYLRDESENDLFGSSGRVPLPHDRSHARTGVDRHR